MLTQHRLAAGIVCHPEVVSLTGAFCALAQEEEVRERSCVVTI